MHYEAPAKTPQRDSAYEYFFYGLALADFDFELAHWLPPLSLGSSSSAATVAHATRSNRAHQAWEREITDAFIDQLRSAGVPAGRLRRPFTAEIQMLVGRHLAGERSIALELQGPVLRAPESRDAWTHAGYRRELAVRTLIGTQLRLGATSPDDVVRELLSGLTRDSVDAAWRTLRRWLKQDPARWKVRLARDQSNLTALRRLLPLAEADARFRGARGERLLLAVHQHLDVASVLHALTSRAPPASLTEILDRHSPLIAVGTEASIARLGDRNDTARTRATDR